MLQLGLLVDSAHKQQALTQLIAQSGHKVSCHLLLSAREAANQQLLDQPLDAWVVDVAEDYCDEQHLLEQLFTQSRVPIILSDSSEFAPGSEEHSAWLRRTGLRLQR